MEDTMIRNVCENSGNIQCGGKRMRTKEKNKKVIWKLMIFLLHV